MAGMEVVIQNLKEARFNGCRGTLKKRKILPNTTGEQQQGPNRRFWVRIRHPYEERKAARKAGGPKRKVHSTSYRWVKPEKVRPLTKTEKEAPRRRPRSKSRTSKRTRGRA